MDGIVLECSRDVISISCLSFKIDYKGFSLKNV